jgi:hypothetical protein
MPRIIEHYKDGLILCFRCKRYLPKENFSERFLRDSKFECKECHRTYVNQYNRKHGVKSREEQRKEREENRQKELEKRLLENPYEEINLAIERLVNERGEYKQKEDNVCGYCDQSSYLGFNGKNYCRKHWFIEALSMGKRLPITIHPDSPEVARKLWLLEELSKLGVNIK